MYPPEGREHPRHDLVRAEPARVHADVRPPVVRLAGAVELLELRRGATGEHRPPPGAARALVEVDELAREPHDRAEVAQGLHAPVVAREAAAGRDHVARLEPERLERLGLELAEARLAVLAEDLGDRLPLARDDHVVRLDEAAAETAREQPPDGRLPGTHEAHEDNVVRRHPPHRIRSRISETRGAAGEPHLDHARARDARSGHLVNGETTPRSYGSRRGSPAATRPRPGRPTGGRYDGRGRGDRRSRASSSARIG